MERNGDIDRLIRVGSAERRPDLYIHALAQLADGVHLELQADGHCLRHLADAYGIADRVRFQGTETDRSPGGPEIPAQTMGELVEGLTHEGDPPSATQRNDGLLCSERIALVTNLPTPYRIPLLTAMSSRLASVGASFRVFFLGAGSSKRPWIGLGGEFDHEVIASLELPTAGRRPRLPLGLESRLDVFEPTLVLCGGFSPLVAPRLARFARRRRTLFGLWSGEVWWRSTASSRSRRILRRWLVGQADFGIAYGFLAGEYLRELGPDLPIVYGRNSSGGYALDRQRPDRPATVELLTVADMTVPGKRVDLLVDALRLLPDLPCRLTIVGGGEESHAAVKGRARLDERIRFLGAVPHARVRQCYAESDVYLFPSEIDIFGLALVEAMGSCLAPVTSTRPGAAADLAVHERNCLAVDAPEAREWANALSRIVTDHDFRLRLGANAGRTISRRWTIDHACEAMFAGMRLGLLEGVRTEP